MTDETVQQDSGDASAPEGGVMRRPETPVARTTASPGVTVKKTQLELTMEASREVFQQYLDKMAITKPVTVEEGTRQQLRLLQAIKKILGLNGADFNAGYGELLKFVFDNRNTVFNERYAFRFMAYLVTVSKVDRTLFERLLNLMLITCNPATRQQVLSRYDWTHLRRTLEESGAADKVIEFYSL